MRVKRDVFDDWETLTDGGDPVAVADPPAQDPAVNEDPPAQDPPAQDPPPEETMVPVKVAQELRKEVQSLKDNNETLTQNNTALTQHIQSNQPQPAQAQQGDDGVGGLFKDKDDDDIPTFGELKRITNAMTNNTNGLFNQFNTRIRNKDYESVVETHLPNVLKDKPHLTELIRTSSDPTALAYEMAQLDPAYQKVAVVATNADAQKILADNTKPMSINQATGGIGPVKENDMTMSKETFEAKVTRILNESR